MDFTIDELRLIKACCVTACPQYPNVPMYEPWASLYTKADRKLRKAEIMSSVSEPVSGPQCRTMLSQRPCGMVSCTRPECSPQRGYRLGCEDNDGRPVRPDCATPNGSCGCGFG